MHIAAQGKCNGWWCKHKLYQCCVATYQSANWSKCFVCVCKWSARMWNARGKFSKTKNECYVQNSNNDRCNQKTNGARNTPAIVPPKIFTGNNQPNCNCPKMYRSQNFFERSSLIAHVHEANNKRDSLLVCNIFYFISKGANGIACCHARLYVPFSLQL